MDEKISIIIPVYNAEKYVEKAILCCLNQTYKNINIVLVNDGSTDKSLEIIKKYSKENHNVFYYSIKNSGSAKYPRDYGTYYAKTDLIIHLDADDYLEADYVDKMYKRLTDTQADIVFPEMWSVEENDGRVQKQLPVNGFLKDKIYTGRELINETIPKWRIGCNGGLYRKHVLNNLAYPDNENPIYINSDEVDTRIYLLNAAKVSFTDARYFHLHNSKSITHHIGTKYFEHVFTNDQLLNIITDAFGKNSSEYKRACNHVCLRGWSMFLRLVRGYNQFSKEEKKIWIGILNDAYNRYVSLEVDAEYKKLCLISQFTTSHRLIWLFNYCYRIAEKSPRPLKNIVKKFI